MAKYAGIILGIFALVGSFVVAEKARADDTDVIINEVMANASTPESDLEWVELYNNGDDPVDLNGWKFDNNTIANPLAIIGSNDYLILARNEIAFRNRWSDVTVPIIQVTMVLANSADTILLKNVDSSYVEEFSWSSDTGDNISWERIDHLADDWLPSLVSGGTPGAENSVSKPLLPPLAPSGISPANFQTIPFTDQVVFQWETADTQPQNFEFILLDQLNPSNIIIDEPDLTYLQYKATNLPPNIYYWQIIASNQTGETASPFYQFTLYNPVYSNAIVVNELMPNPSGDETKNEWIELYNDSDEPVDLNGWHLKDLYGSTHDFAIFNIKGTIIGPRQFLLFYRGETDITLNNDTDSVALVQPNSNILYETPIFSGDKEGWSWARGPDGTWSWTTEPTVGGENKISLPVEETEEKIENPPINTIPIEINTGDYQDYLDKLVKVTGKVTSTSGNTFYLDDGSGEVKIYIQEKTGIDKPEMHKNDIFEVVGIVDLYGKTWRILPQKQEDVQLIEATIKSSTAKSSSAKKTSSVIKAIGTAANIGPKKVEAADNSPPSENSTKTPLWMQIVKAAVALALILFIVLVIKLRQRPKEKTIGGNFGDDET